MLGSGSHKVEQQSTQTLKDISANTDLVTSQFTATHNKRMTKEDIEKEEQFLK